MSAFTYCYCYGLSVTYHLDDCLDRHVGLDHTVQHENCHSNW